MADRYGYYGEVSYQNQNRFRPYSIAGLGSIPAVASGGYRGQPGKLIYPRPVPSRERDRALFGALDIRLAGPGFGATDREICATLTQVGGGLVSAATSAFGAQPVRRAGETTSQYEARLREWQLATRTTTTGGQAITTASALCNLIDEAAQPAPTNPSSTANEWQLMQAREELRRMYEQQQQQRPAGIPTNTLLLVGGGIAAAAAVYFLLFR